jgi:hypothetical protein
MSDFLRRPIMMTVAGTFASVAMWSLFIKPMHRELAEKQQQLAAQQSRLDQAALERSRAEVDPAQLIDEFKSLAMRYEESWSLSADSAAVYAKFDELAGEAGVSIDRIEPSRTGAGFDMGGGRVTQCGFVVELRGPYDQVLHFIELTQTRMGLTRVSSVRLNPATVGADQGVVQANLVTEHFGVEGLFAQAKEVLP